MQKEEPKVKADLGMQSSKPLAKSSPSGSDSCPTIKDWFPIEETRKVPPIEEYQVIYL